MVRLGFVNRASIPQGAHSLWVIAARPFGLGVLLICSRLRKLFSALAMAFHKFFQGDSAAFQALFKGLIV